MTNEAFSRKPPKKTVPLVVYTDGRRNEIGEAEITVWPGEIRVEGSITGVIPILGLSAE